MKQFLPKSRHLAWAFFWLLTTTIGWGQQVIGNFPYMDGGFENQTIGALGTSLSTTNWSRQNQSGASSSISSISPRSGSNFASVTSAATASRNLQTPNTSLASDGPLANTSYVVQYYVRNTSSVNGFQSGVTVNGTSNPSYSTAATLSSNTNWFKYVRVITTPNVTVSSTGIGLAGRAQAGLFDVDDFVIYQGASVDETAPNAPGTVTVSGATNSSLIVSWGTASGGVDGGGYVVVRYAVNPNADNDPNQNGIYAVGNTITNGTGSLVGTVRYIGTSTSFTDNVGLSEGTQYWYKVYTVDKAFNYSAESTANGTTLISNLAPIASSVNISGTLNIGQTLTGGYTYSDADGDTQGTSTFQWYRADDASGTNSIAISGATVNTYTLQAADTNKYIRFGVIPVAATGTSPGVEAFSSWVGPIIDPTAVTASITPNQALTEQNLNGNTLTLALTNTTFVDSTLDIANFTLNNAPSGVTISGISYSDANTAVITLAYNDTDFDANVVTFSVTIAASELTSAAILTSNNLTITAVTETLSVSAINSFGSLCLNAESTQTFTVSGTNLKAGNVNLASLNGYTYSLDNTTFTTTIDIPTAGGTLNATTVYVKLTPVAVISYDGNIVVLGVGAPSVNRSVVGSGVNTPPSITTPTSASVTVNSATLGGTITALGCTNVTERGIFYSTTNGFADGAGTKVSETSGPYTTGAFTINTTGLISNTVYYYKAFATSASGTVYTTQGTFTTAALTAPVATAANNVGETSFTANWNAVAEATGYVIDVYEKTPIYATDLIISEYVEGSSNNKYIEIFNGTGTFKELSGYEIRLYANGASTPSNTEILNGTLLNNQTLVFRNSSASLAGTTSFSISSTANFNGDDAIAIYNTNTNSFVDIFGRIGSDPGSAWTGSGGYTTLDRTLVRKSDVISGVAVNPTGTGEGAFTTLTTEWDLYGIDNVTNLGSHTFNPGFNSVSVVQNLNVGNVTTYQVTGLNPNKNYFYVVRATDGGSQSVNSNEIAATTDGPFLWTGTTSNLWNVATNWFGGVVPDGSKDVIIASGTPQLNVNYTIPTGSSVSIEGSGNLNIAAANTLTLVGDLSIAIGTQITNAGIIEVSEGTITDNRTTKNYGGTVIYNGSSNQDILGATYNNLEVIENNTKSLVANTNVNGTLFLTEGTLNNSTFLTLGNGATINRSGGVLNAIPTFTTSVNVTYSENNALITTGNEIPSVDTVLNNLTINNTAGVKASGDITVNGVLNLASANPNATDGALDMVIAYGTYGTVSKLDPNNFNSTLEHNNLNSYVLNLGATATVTGVGDVTGKVSRTQTFVNNTTYAFSNANMTLNFNDGGNATNLPTKITVISTRGTKGLHADKDVADNGNPAIGGAAVQRLWQILRTGGDAATRFTVRFPYQDTELNGNTEGNLVTWDHHLDDPAYAGITPHEHGKTNNDANNNFVELANHSLFYLTTEGSTTNTKYWMLSDQITTNNTWLGAADIPAGQSNWNSTSNWTSGVAPTANDHVVIEPVGVAARNPEFVSGSYSFGSMEIKSGAEVDAGAATITLNNGPASNGNVAGSWLNNGTFNAGTSTVIFNAGVDNLATLAGNTNFHHVTVNTGKTLRLEQNAVMGIAGTLTVNGALDATQSENTVVFNGTTDQTVPATTTDNSSAAYHTLELAGDGVKSFEATPSIKGNLIKSGTSTVTIPSQFNFNGTTAQSIAGFDYNNIEFSNAGTKTFTSAASVSPTAAITFAGTPGAVDFDGSSDNLTFVLKSDTNGTARVADASNWNLNGKVTAERFVPNRRAWRLLTAPTKGSTSNTVQDNWQGTNGEGVLLWGPSGIGLAVGPQNNIYSYNGAWTPVTNTTTTNLFDADKNNAFLVFAVGPHGGNNIASTNAAVETTLRPKGNLITGNVNYTGLTTNTFHLIANPYASPISTSALKTTNPDFNIWLLDPTLGSFGGYYTYDGSSWAPITPTIENTNIQSGQGFFVSSASANSFTINETHKAVGNSNTWFAKPSVQTTEENKIRVLLDKQENNQWQLVDGILSVSGNNYANEVDAQDALKVSNFNENILFRNGTSNLAIEYQNMPTTATEQPIRLTGTTATAYRLRVKTEGFVSVNMQPILQDTQSGTNHLIPTDGSILEVNFTGVAATASNPDTRFKIVYQQPLGVALPESNTLQVYPNPVREGQFNIALPNTTEGATYEISNYLGQVVQKGELAPSNTKVSVAHQAAGVYLVKVQQNGAVYTTKIVKK